MSFAPFAGEGRFYKGCLHGHTTRSDGELTPQEYIALYKSKGYDFLAITDHRRYNNGDFGQKDMIILPGVELDFSPANGDLKNYHIVALGDMGYRQEHPWRSVYYDEISEVQSAIDLMKSRGAITMFCHPEWSNLTSADCNAIHGFDLCEVYNGGCHLGGDTASGQSQIDEMLRCGKQFFLTATDDGHSPDQMGLGFVQVFCREFTAGTVCQALREGRFYASWGPEIYDLRIIDDEITVKCSPCSRIILRYPHFTGQWVYSQENDLTTATFQVPKDASYIRLQVSDEYNRSAWCQPVWR